MRSHANTIPYFLCLLPLTVLACTPASTSLDAQSPDASAMIDARGATVPSVVSTSPVSGAMNAPLNGNATVTFSEPMAPGSFHATTFTLATGTPSVAVPGTVVVTGATAVLWPSTQLAANTTYTATVTTEATSALGVPLAASRVWSFTTGSTRVPGLGVDLGCAGDFAILAKTGISTVPTSVITGDLGVSPAAATFITGFSLTADATNVFATATQVTGRVFAADYAVPTPDRLTTCVGDMQRAFTDAAGRAPDVTELGAGNIGGLTIARGVYRWGTGLLIPTDVTLTGTATDVWIFQVAGDLTMANGAHIVLAGGALARNIVWQVSGGIDLGTTAHGEGVYLGQTAINLRTGAAVHGRLLAQTAVAIDGATVIAP